jgi:hypothetical protein
MPSDKIPVALSFLDAEKTTASTAIFYLKNIIFSSFKNLKKHNGIKCC